MKKTVLLWLIYFVCASSYAQSKLEIQRIYKTDTAAYRESLAEFEGENKNVTMIINVASANGYFSWLFEKEPRATEGINGSKPGKVFEQENYNLYAHLMLHDHGGFIKIAVPTPSFLNHPKVLQTA